LKISILLKIFIPLFIFLSASTFISILIFTSAIEKSVATINLQTEYKQVGSDILNSLDRLTRLARSYSQFGQKFYYDEYLHEFNTVNARENTVVRLKQFEIEEDKLALIYQAIFYSNELAETEAKSFKYVANNNLEHARKLLFSAEYNDKRKQVRSSIKEFQAFVDNKAELEAEHVQKVFTRMFITTIILVFSTIIISIVSFVFITKKVKDISRLTEIAKEVTTGNLDIPIMSSNAKDELGDLTRSFVMMLDTIKGITTDLSYIAKTDALTQVPNRHSFLANAPSFFDFHIRLGNPLTLLFFDIDDFKKINDNFGHSFGDDVLKSFAIVVSEVIRSFDLFCRYGGEEFILMLSNTDERGAIIVGERIMENLKRVSFPEKPGFKYTVSIGLFSGIPQKGETVDEYINKSDLGMYIAKKNGKNRIGIYKEK